MLVHASRLAPIVLLVVLSLIMPSSAYTITNNHALTQGLVNVHLKLQALAPNRDINLSLEELERVSSQYHSWPEELKSVLRTVPDLRLTIDLAIAPMRLEKPPELQTIKENYQLLKLSYSEGFSEYKTRRNVDNIMKLYNKIVKDSKELELDDFVAAKRDALGYLKEMNDLAENGLIHQKRSDYMDLIRLFNHNRVKALYVYVFPAMKRTKDVEELKRLFLDNESLFQNQYLVNGEVFVKPIDTAAGFMYVA